MKWELDLREFDRLEGLLRTKGIKYERIDLKSSYAEHHEIFYPSRAWHTADAILNSFSVGHTKGLLEYYGALPNGQIGIEGKLKADDIFERICDHDSRRIKRELRRIDLCDH